jgi:hypothetical protein
MKDKFLVVVIDDLNIVHKQMLCETYKKAEEARDQWRFRFRGSNKDVEIQLLSECAQCTEDWKVITLPDNWA